MEETIEAIEIDKRTVVSDVLNRTTASFTHFNFVKKLTTFDLTLLFDELTTGNDDIFAIKIDLKDFKVVRLADVLIQILGRLDIDLRSRKESVYADADD